MKINNMLLVLNMIGADIDKLYSMVRDIVPDHIKFRYEYIFKWNVYVFKRATRV